VDGCDRFSNLAGTFIETCSVDPTGGWQSWTDVECPIEPTDGMHDVYLRFGGTDSEPLFNLDYFQFE
jgi:arabinoxylan arabinofuranohydrolase